MTFNINRYNPCSSISAQSSYAIGAVLNASFGSIVELILYIVSLVKGKQADGTYNSCYAELVKSGLAGRKIAPYFILFLLPSTAKRLI